jgi:hypothetical protein
VDGFITKEVNLSVTLFKFFREPLFFLHLDQIQGPGDDEKQYNILIKFGNRNKNIVG